MTAKRIPVDDGTVMQHDLAECRWKMKDCRAYRNGGCLALSDTKFTRPCPFYKAKRRDNHE